MSCLNPNTPIYIELKRLTESPAQTELILKYKSINDEFGMIPMLLAKPVYKEFNLITEDDKLKTLPLKEAEKWLKTLDNSKYFDFKLAKMPSKDYTIHVYLKEEEQDLYLRPGEGIQGDIFGISSSLINELNQDNNDNRNKDNRGSDISKEKLFQISDLKKIFSKGLRILQSDIRGGSNIGSEIYTKLNKIQQSISEKKPLSNESIQELFRGNSKTTENIPNDSFPKDIGKREYITLRLLQSLNSNKINSRLRTKLGVDSITLVEDDKAPTLYTEIGSKTIFINLNKLEKTALERNNFDNFIDLAVFEELLHIATFTVNTQEQLDEALKSFIEAGGTPRVNALYSKNVILTDRQAFYEGVRMKIQDIFSGKTTEDTMSDFYYDKSLQPLLLRLWNFLKDFFTNDVPNKLIVDNIVNYINSQEDIIEEEQDIQEDNNEILGISFQETKSELEELLEDTEKLSLETLTPVIDEFYYVLNNHLNNLVKNKNYLKIAEVLTVKGSNQVAIIEDSLRRASEITNEISKQKTQALSLAKSVLQIDYLIDLLKPKISEISEDKDNALENIGELQRYLDMIDQWNTLLSTAKEIFNDQDKIRKKIVLVQDKIHSLRTSIIKNDKSGIVSMMREVLQPYSLKYNKNAQEEIKKIELLIKRKEEKKKPKEEIDKLKLRLQQKQAEINALDFENDNNILEFLEGKRGDTSAFTSSIRAYRDSNNPTIFGFASFMRNLIDENTYKSYKYGVAYEKELAPFLKQSDRLDPSIMNKAITFIDKDGSLYLLNPWKDYKFDYNELKDKEKIALATYRGTNNQEDEKAYLEAKKARQQFEEDYLFRPYTDAYYDKNKFYDDEIGQELKKESDAIWEEYNNIDIKIGDMQPTPEEMELKKALLRDYQRLGSIYSGNKEKKGLALDKAHRMREIKALNAKIYEFKPNFTLFEETKEKFKEYLITEKGYHIDSPEYTTELLQWTDANTRTVVTQQWYKDVENLMLKLQILFERSQNKEIKDKITDQWKIIKDAIYANKDEDNQPIGSIIDPLPSEKIKSAQESIENLKQIAQELGNLTPKQLERLKELEDLQEYGTLSPSEKIELLELNSLHSVSSPTDKALLKKYLQELSEIQSKLPTSYYVDEFNSISSQYGILIDDNGNVLEEDENGQYPISILDSPKLDELLENKDFNDWFHRNHIYIKKYNKETYSYEDVWQRTFQWSVNKPNDAKYYEVLPSLAYSKREVRPEYMTGYNEKTKQVELVVGKHITNISQHDFLPDPSKTKSSIYSNEKYHNLKDSKDSTSQRYFSALQIHTKRTLESQEDAMYQAKIWLAVPSVLKTSTEKKVDIIKAATKPKSMSLDVWNKIQDKYKAVTNFSEDDAFGYEAPLKEGSFKDNYRSDFIKVPIQYTNAVDSDLVSLDLHRSISLYNNSIELNKLLVKNLPIAKALKRLIQATKDDNKVTSLENTLKSIEDIILREFEGSTSNRGANKHAVAAVGFAKKAAGSALISLNTVAATSNLTGGLTQNWINSWNNLYTAEDYARATSTYILRFAPGIIKDKFLNEVGTRTLESQLYALWQPVMGLSIEDIIGDRTGSAHGLNLINHINPVSAFREGSEFYIQTNPWIATLVATKVERSLSDGSTEMISLYDAYTLDSEGNLSLKEGVNPQWLGTGMLFHKKKADVQQFIRTTQGNYDRRDKTRLETNIYGSSAMFLKRYLIDMSANMFGATGDSYLDIIKLKGGDYINGNPRGYIYQTIQVGHYLVKNGINNWDTLTTQDKQALVKTAKLISILIVLYLLKTIALGYSGDDKDTKKELAKHSWFQLTALVAILRLEQELGGFYSIDNWITNIPGVSVFRGLKKWLDFIKSVLPNIEPIEMSIKQDTYKSTKKNVRGEIIYKEGDKTWSYKLMDALGINSPLNMKNNPDQVLKNMSKMK